MLIYDFFKWNYVYPSTGNAISCFFSSRSVSVSHSLPHFFFGGFCTLSIFLFALCGPQQFDPHVFMFSGVLWLRLFQHFYDAFDKLVENLLFDVLIDEEWQGNLEYKSARIDGTCVCVCSTSIQWSLVENWNLLDWT